MGTDLDLLGRVRAHLEDPSRGNSKTQTRVQFGRKRRRGQILHPGLVSRRGQTDQIGPGNGKDFRHFVQRRGSQARTVRSEQRRRIQGNHRKDFGFVRQAPKHRIGRNLSEEEEEGPGIALGRSRRRRRNQMVSLRERHQRRSEEANPVLLRRLQRRHFRQEHHPKDHEHHFVPLLLGHPAGRGLGSLELVQHRRENQRATGHLGPNVGRSRLLLLRRTTFSGGDDHGPLSLVHQDHLRHLQGF